MRRAAALLVLAWLAAQGGGAAAAPHEPFGVAPGHLEGKAGVVATAGGSVRQVPGPAGVDVPSRAGADAPFGGEDARTARPLAQRLAALREEVGRLAGEVASLRKAAARQEDALLERRREQRDAAGRLRALGRLLAELAGREQAAAARQGVVTARAGEARRLYGAAVAGLGRGGALPARGRARLAALAGAAAGALHATGREKEELRAAGERSHRRLRHLDATRERLGTHRDTAARAVAEARVRLDALQAALRAGRQALAVAERRASRASVLLAAAGNALGAGLERPPRGTAIARPEIRSALARLDRASAGGRLMAALRHPPAGDRGTLPPEAGADAGTEALAAGILLAGGLDRLPVRGRPVRAFGGGGLLDRGITFQLAAAGPVEAPRRGRVAFAGPFKSFGLLLILDHGDGYHTLLSGFSALDVRRGEEVVAGQPVGRVAVDDRGRGLLYMELRRGGEPVDPMPHMAAREDRVRS